MKKKYAILIAGSACMLGAANTWANVTIDLSEAAYPPLVKKFAAGGFFEKNDTAATTAIAQTGDIHLPMYRANIREPRLNYTTKTGTNKGIWLGNNPATGSDLGLLYKTSSGVVHPNFDLNLDNLRATVATDSMLNYIRWDGVPFLVTTNAISAGVGSANDDDLFDAPSSYGPVDSSDSWDWSPPPHSGNARINFASKMGEFIALMVDSEKINGDGFRPTIWAFWQEPDHCLGDPSTPYAHHSDGLTSAEKFDNIRMCVKDLYQPLSSQVKAADPDLMVSGVAQNS
ncbi:MAG: hypothetical protein K9L89_08710, partial [Kiritimatiellales bacterium]|nr:hypothetical protein [Kiritimatiellales bacterium]